MLLLCSAPLLQCSLQIHYCHHLPPLLHLKCSLEGQCDMVSTHTCSHMLIQKLLVFYHHGNRITWSTRVCPFPWTMKPTIHSAHPLNTTQATKTLAKARSGPLQTGRKEEVIEARYFLMRRFLSWYSTKTNLNQYVECGTGKLERMTRRAFSIVSICIVHMHSNKNAS